jgi:hypothetical protein
MNIALMKPYTYELSNPEKVLGIIYTPKGPGGIPHLTLQHQDCIRTFKGEEITESKVQGLDLVTVVLSKELVLGAPRVCLSLLLPEVYLIGEAPVKTYYIKRTREAATSPATHIPPINTGQREFYEIIELTGTARSKED